jgi:FtsP/CotA-like multicopper oxidase with cupredoxin domain
MSEDVMTDDRARILFRRLYAALPAALAALLAQMPAAHAVECLPISQPLVKIPEIISTNGRLHGTIVLQEVQERMIFRIPQLNGAAVPPGTPGAVNQCLPQNVRAFRAIDPSFPLRPDPHAIPNLPDPLPGPTLRARVGDIVELTFVNQLDPAKFGASENRGVKDTAQGCDIVNVGQGGTAGYPYKSANPLVLGDSFPDCFHGSASANIHFHGTHTNPNGTADNVFLELRPSPRANGRPTIGPDTYKGQFTTFFKACEEHLRGNPLEEWPSNWNQAPLGPWKQLDTWTDTQLSLLEEADRIKDRQVAGAGQWPQFYIGAYPYCFQLPDYTFTTFPPPSGVRMGQAPGTHWYHAHKHGSTAIDVANGMVGAFIIEGPSYDDELNKFYNPGWTRDQPIMVINQIGVQPNLKRAAAGGAGQNDKGPDFSVNGRAQPIVTMRPGEVQMWRIVNGSGRSGVFLRGFPPGFNFRQIAQDGVQFANNSYLASQNKALLIASGNRADLLVQAPTTPGLYPLMVQHDVDPSDLAAAIPVVLLQIRVPEGVPPVPNTDHHAQFIPAMPQQPAFLTNITDEEVGGTLNNPRVIKFATGDGPPFAQHTINDHKFDDDAPPVLVTLNAVEQWKIVNYTFGPPISHPFHIHLNPFQITEVFDPNALVKSQKAGTVRKYVADKKDYVDDSVQCLLDLTNEATWKDCKNVVGSDPRIWWDVFPIPSGARMSDDTHKNVKVPGYFMLRSRFVDYPGNYVIHCHILAHEDRGMMTVVRLQPLNANVPMLLTHH